jgi:hypothetical protein
MSNRREQRLRRKARAAIRRLDSEISRLRPVALSAIRYIAEIDAPNQAEPYSIAKRRDELRDVVHASQGRPGRPRRDAQVLRAPAVAPVVPSRPTAPARSGGEALQRGKQEPSDNAGLSAGAVTLTGGGPCSKRTVRAPIGTATRATLARDVELKRRDLEHAAQRFGAVANDKRHRVDWRPLSEAMQRAARALVSAERRLAEIALVDARRSA